MGTLRIISMDPKIAPVGNWTRVSRRGAIYSFGRYAIADALRLHLVHVPRCSSRHSVARPLCGHTRTHNVSRYGSISTTSFA